MKPVLLKYFSGEQQLKLYHLGYFYNKAPFSIFINVLRYLFSFNLFEMFEFEVVVSFDFKNKYFSFFVKPFYFYLFNFKLF